MMSEVVARRGGGVIRFLGDFVGFLRVCVFRSAHRGVWWTRDAKSCQKSVARGRVVGARDHSSAGVAGRDSPWDWS